MLILIIYLISFLDKFISLLTVVNVISILSTLILAGFFLPRYIARERPTKGKVNPCEVYYGDREMAEKIKPWLIKLLLCAIISSSIIILIPDSKILAAMYIIPKVAKNKELISIPDKALKIFNAKLDNYLIDLTNK